MAVGGPFSGAPGRRSFEPNREVRRLPGQVDRHRVELTEPFATLLDRNLLRDLAEERETGQRVDMATDDRALVRQDRIGPSAVMSRCFACPSNTNQPDGLVRLGSNKIYLVPPVGFEPTLSEV
jgi:hypothetical protein